MAFKMAQDFFSLSHKVYVAYENLSSIYINLINYLL